MSLFGDQLPSSFISSQLSTAIKIRDSYWATPSLLALMPTFTSSCLTTTSTAPSVVDVTLMGMLPRVCGTTMKLTGAPLPEATFTCRCLLLDGAAEGAEELMLCFPFLA